jgi:hypothetical protein
MPVTLERPAIGVPSAPVSDRRGVGDQREAGRGERREAEADQDRAGDGDRRAETRCAFKERAEAERDQQKLQPPVLSYAADRRLQRLEHAPLHRQAVEEDDVEHDPADGEEAGDGAEHGGAERHARGHREDDDGHEIRHDQRDDGGEMRFDFVGGDQREQRHHRQSGGDGR